MIGLMPYQRAVDYGRILRKVAGAISPLAVGDGVIVLQALGNTGVSRPVVSGLTTLASGILSYNVSSNNGSTTASGNSSYRLSYGQANTTSLSVTSLYTADIISKTNGGPVILAPVLTGSGLYTPPGGLKSPLSYLELAYSAGATSPGSVNVDSFSAGTVNGIPPTVGRFYSTGSLHTITAGTNSVSAVVQLEINVWESNFGNAPINYSAGAGGNRQLFAVYAQ